MNHQIAFLIIATTIALFSMRLNFALTGLKLSADRAFWYTWLFLVWSAELVTTIPFFDLYNQYPIDPTTRKLVLIVFMTAAIGFLIGSILYRQAQGGVGNLPLEGSGVSLARRWQRVIASAIFVFGAYEFASNRSRFSDLLDLRLAAVSGDLLYSPVSVQFFYFAQAFILFLGFSDGLSGRVSRHLVTMSVGGLILHNLSLGGRINVVVAPALYLIALIISASQRPDWSFNTRSEIRRTVRTFVISIMFAFTAIGLLRSQSMRDSLISDPYSFLFNSIFAIPMYVSDTYISISVHSMHAMEALVPFGYFTFDAFYRLASLLVPSTSLDVGDVFGHGYYRDTAAPWAWTQTNMIPRLIADFGSNFWLAIAPIAIIAQWMSLYRFRMRYFGIAVRSMMVLCSAYSILGLFWFSAFTVYTLLYAFILHILVNSRPSR
ncbi:MAG: hypothetical protein RLZZ444_2672 [Pseudomonadota bacterium]|jgi:hypothetical protein